MMDNPADFLEPFAAAGADILGFHVEVTRDVAGVITRIRNLGKRVSLTLNPGTELTAADPYLDAVDQVLCMTVHPGFGGQTFIPEVLNTVRHIRQLGPPSLDIEVDGGINADTARRAVSAGANVLVAGTAVFGADDRAAAIAVLRRAGAAM